MCWIKPVYDYWVDQTFWAGQFWWMEDVVLKGFHNVVLTYYCNWFMCINNVFSHKILIKGILSLIVSDWTSNQWWTINRVWDYLVYCDQNYTLVHYFMSCGLIKQIMLDEVIWSDAINLPKIKLFKLYLSMIEYDVKGLINLMLSYF